MLLLLIEHDCRSRWLRTELCREGGVWRVRGVLVWVGVFLVGGVSGAGAEFSDFKD